MSLDTLLQKLKANTIDYKALAANSFMFLSTTPRDINIFIGAKNRAEYLRTTLLYLNRAIVHNTVLKYKITVIEHDKVSNLSEVARVGGADYIWCNANATTWTENEFSRALAFNVGHLWCQPAKYELHHDADLLCDYTFFCNLAPLIAGGVLFAQPYKNKHVRMLGEGVTRQILNAEAFVNLDYVGDFKLYGQSACGGSLLIQHSAMERCGLYEAELLYGYAGEDSFMWQKLECLVGETLPSLMPHCGNGNYSKDNWLYHLAHGISHWTPTPRWTTMNSYYETFALLSYYDKMRYITAKVELNKESK